MSSITPPNLANIPSEARSSPDAMLKEILAQLLSNAPSAVTFAAIETAISAAGFDPHEESDLYSAILDALDAASILVVEQLELLRTPGDDTAVEIADETLTMLRETYTRISQTSHPLLRAADEQRLLEIYQDGQRALAEQSSEGGYRQQRALERRIMAGKDAMEALMSHNIRLVASYAYKVAGQTNHLDTEDLIQEGLIGLQRAIVLYRLDVGCRLSTYATYWIRQAIQRAVADQDRMVRLPVHLIESLHAISRTVRELTHSLGRAPSEEELALATGNSIARLRKLQLLNRSHLSLDLPMSEDGASTLGDMLPDTRMMDPEESLIERNRQETIRQFMLNNRNLTPIERRIISLRFGFEDGEKWTLQEIGDLFHLTRERIRQLETRALRKLRHDADHIHLQSYLED